MPSLSPSAYHEPRTRLDGVRLFLLGFLTLFLELMLIRYLSGNIWNLGYFPNLVLIGVFIGMGAGFSLHQLVSDTRSRAVFHGAFLLLGVLVVLVALLHPKVPGFHDWLGDFGGDLYFTSVPKTSTGGDAPLFVLWFLSIVAIFSFISQRTAKLFRGFAPLHAYTLDIGGSCCGILAFMAISWLQAPAWAWFLILLVLVLLSEAHPGLADPWRWVTTLALVGGAVLAQQQDGRLPVNQPARGPVTVRWSPYQKIEYAELERAGHRIFANGIAHQHMARPEDILHAPARAIPYSLPYEERQRHPELPPYRSVLVLGAGSGNDVAAAVLHHAEHVDAVEIDPAIAEIGRAHHPAHPYQAPQVHLTVGDGRAFLTQTPRKYDLIIFALTDSVVKVSPMAQLRLENYLFTQESVTRAYGLLNEGGDLLFYNFYRRPWLLQKIEQLIMGASGAYPRRLLEKNDFLMLVAGKHNRAPAPAVAPEVEVPRDDWPFLYLKQRGVPPVYAGALGGLSVVLIGLMALLHRASRTLSVSKTGEEGLSGLRGLLLKLAFAAMGVAFLLLESKSVIQFSLLFGTTWLNNSLVFLAVLVLVLTANWVAVWFSPRLLLVLFGLLLGACMLTLAFPLSGLLAVESPIARFLLGSLMTFSPIFFANLIFSVTFRDQSTPEHVFGWNLIGATLGGAVEYTSLAIGYNQLSVLVAVCYTVALVALVLAGRRANRGGEVASPGGAPA